MVRDGREGRRVGRPRRSHEDALRAPRAAVRRSIEIVDAARTLGNGGNPLVFPGRRRRQLDGTTLTRILKDSNIPAVAHGFRSTFRDWAAEETAHPREVIKAALAHVVGNKVEAAYARSDLFERRRRLMGDWEPALPASARSGRDQRLRRRRRPTPACGLLGGDDSDGPASHIDAGEDYVGGPACASSRLINSFSSLPALK